MICKRCGSGCPERVEGYCFHCLVAVFIDEATGGKIIDGTIAEGFPHWQKPSRKDKKQSELGGQMGLGV